MKSKSWILNLITAILFFVAALLYLTDAKYIPSVLFIICGILFLVSSRINYKKTHTGAN